MSEAPPLRKVLDFLRSGDPVRQQKALAVIARFHMVEARTALSDFLHGLPAGPLHDAASRTLTLLAERSRHGSSESAEGSAPSPPVEDPGVPKGTGRMPRDVHGRLEAVIEASATKDRSAADDLLFLCKSEREPLIRRMLAKALERVLGKEGFWPIVENLLGDSDPEVRISAVEALEEMGDLRACPFFFRLLADSHEKVHAHVVAALGHFSRPQLLQAAEVASHSKDVAMRRAAASALINLGEPASLPLLQHLLEDSDEEVIRLARCALKALSDGGLEEATLLLAALEL